MTKLILKTALTTYGHTSALKDKTVSIDGTDLDFVEVRPHIAAFRRMVRDLEFDVCELAPTTYLIARYFGAPFKALPIFLTRRFHHHGLMVRNDSGIRAPKELEGKKVGVRAYSVTTGVWTRGILVNEFGLDSSKVTWVVDDEEHVPQLKLPPNVVHVRPGQSLAGMMESGEIQAGFAARTGIGREGPPQADWEQKARPAKDIYHDLFDDPAPLEAEWYRRTGIYPLHTLIVVEEDILANNPRLAESLFQAFVEAKERYLARLRSGKIETPDDKKYLDLTALVGEDPLPYGVVRNRPALETLMGYAVQQGMIPERMPIDRLFVDVGRG